MTSQDQNLLELDEIEEISDDAYLYAVQNGIDKRVKKIHLNGQKGWSPVLILAQDGNRVVLQLNDWTGGAGDKPTTPEIGSYISINGYTLTIGDAIDIRGYTGAQAESVSFVDDDIVFVLNDASTVTLVGGKIDLKGDTGNGIDNIALIETVGKVKTYRITYTDATTFDYTITDGADGDMLSSIYDPENKAAQVIVEGDNAQLNSIKFDITPTEQVYAEGQMFWDPLNKTVKIQTGLDGDNDIEIGDSINTTVGNESGVDLEQPNVVRISGENGTLGFPLVSKAIANSLLSSDLLGVLTTSIPSGVNNIGKAVTIGNIHKVDTSAFNLNDTLYLSASVAGGLTNIKPVSPNFVRPIAKVVRVHATDGIIFVNTSISSAMDANQIFEDMINPNGFPEGQKANVILAYDYTTRTLTLTGTFFYYNKGIKYIKTNITEQVTHADTIGTYFVYYDGNTLTLSTTPFNYLRHVHVAYIVFNNTAATTFWNGAEGILFDERHGMIMDGQTHLELHQTIGAYVKGGSGFALNGTYSVATGTGGLIANSFGIDSGIIADEDLETAIVTLNDAAGIGNIYPIFYRTGAGTEWRWYKNNLPYLFASTNILWNQFTGGSWQLTQTTNNGRYLNYYVCATNSLNPDYRFVIIPTQTEHTSLINAQGENVLSLDLTGLPFAEIVPLWQITWRRDGSYDDNGNCRIESNRKIVGTRLALASSNVSVSNHNNLSNRSDPNSHPAIAISVTSTTENPGAELQAAIENLNISTQTEKTTPVDADKFSIWDSVLGLKNALSWVNIKATLKVYFDSVSTTLTNKTLTTPTITKPVMSATNPTDQTYSPAAAGTATLDCSLSNTHAIQLPAGNITIALSNDTNNQKLLIKVKQDSVGSRTVTWFSGIVWAGGSPPTLTSGANKTDIIGIYRTGAGAYIGVVVAQNI